MTDTTADTTGTATDRRGFTLTWTFDAPRSRVFRAWTDPAHLGWFYNDEFPEPPEPIELDLRVGGAWRQMMVYTADDRKWAGGVYREIVADEVLEFAFGAVGGWPELAGGGLDDAAIVRIVLSDAPAGGTLLTLDVDLPRTVDADTVQELLGAMRAGWLQTVDRLRSALSSPPAI